MFQVDPMKSGPGRPAEFFETILFLSLVSPSFPLGAVSGHEFRTGVTGKVGPLRLWKVIQPDFDQRHPACVLAYFPG